MSQTEGAERIQSQLVAWGTVRDDVRAIAVVGSRARRERPADDFSDLDVVVMARRPARYREESGWLAEIATPWLVVREPTVVGGQEIFLVTFEGGIKADVVVVSSRAFSLAARIIRTAMRHPFLLTWLPSLARERLEQLSDLLTRGFRMLVDKDDLGRRLGDGGLPPASPALPSEDEYLQLVKRCLNEQVWVALKLGRGELFVAKTAGESRLMEVLLQMIEWHTLATTGRWSPVQERGRFLEQWAPASIVERLPALFPLYDAAAVWRARLTAFDVFEALARETGDRLGYAYPERLAEVVMGWVRAQSRVPGVTVEDPR